ncbi:MAG: alpha/beta hydrolase family protein [Byssovorax sp.]
MSRNAVLAQALQLPPEGRPSPKPSPSSKPSAPPKGSSATSTTLMLVGELDTDCPPPQSRELWQALRTLGVPTQLVVYPQETHGFSQAEHRRDRVERMFDWFNRHMPAR